MAVRQVGPILAGVEQGAKLPIVSPNAGTLNRFQYEDGLRRGDFRSDLLGKQDHGATRQRRIRPVLAGVEQGAEAAYSFPEREQFVGDLVGGAPDYEVIEDAVQVDGLVGRVRILLEEIAA